MQTLKIICMDYIKKQDTISIVLVGTFEPIYFHGNWMYDKGIINIDEWNRYKKNQNTLILPAASKFNIDCFEFICDQHRLQIMTEDISASERIIDMLRNIILSLPSFQISAIGINSEMIMGFTSAEDGYKFGTYFVNLNVWNGILNEPLVQQFAIEEKKDANNQIAKRTITIKSSGGEKIDEEKRPLVSISINNHFTATSEEEIISILNNAENLYTDFRDIYNRLIKNI